MENLGLATLSQLGIPIWVLIVVLLLQLMNSVGLLNPIKKAANAITEDRTREREFRRDRARDQEEALQERQAQSLNQVIQINQTLIETLIRVVDNQINLLREIRASQISQQGRLELVSQKWERYEEILSDIDLFLHETKQELAAQSLAIEHIARSYESLKNNSDRYKASGD